MGQINEYKRYFMINNTHVDGLNFSDARILVVGDVMLDQYWYGNTSRISPEAPVPVVKVNRTDNRLGGAANVAANLVSLGCTVKLLGISGQDAAADTLTKLLNFGDIAHELVKVQQFPTIIKLRIMSRHQQMIRLDHEEESYDINIENLKLIYDCYAAELSNFQMIILSDYAKGMLTNPRPFIDAANCLGIPVIVDPKNSDFSVYRGAQIVKPNLSEFEHIVGKCANLAILEERARNLLGKSGVDSLVITRGADGISVVSSDKPAVHVPAYSGEVYDVTGAGDTVIAVLAAGLASGLELAQAVNFSSVAAGIVVGKVGTSSVSMPELKAAVSKTKNLPLGIIAEMELQQIIKASQANGEKVVFINGCYDLVHFGHINYISKARALGDRLVVGVNSDASVKRLKGDNRPIYNTLQRMQVLAALADVDWVVSFEENTPGRLVASLSPDILVKSGDNYSSVDQIPSEEGADHVLARGGSLHLVARTEGCSSTDMIETMNADA